MSPSDQTNPRSDLEDEYGQFFGSFQPVVRPHDPLETLTLEQPSPLEFVPTTVSDHVRLYPNVLNSLNERELEPDSP